MFGRVTKMKTEFRLARRGSNYYLQYRHIEQKFKKKWFWQKPEVDELIKGDWITTDTAILENF